MLAIAVGLFVVALLVVGWLLMTGDDDDDGEQLLSSARPTATGSGLGEAQATATSTSTATAAAQPTSTATATDRATPTTTTTTDDAATATADVVEAEPTDVPAEPTPTDALDSADSTEDAPETVEDEPTAEPVIGEFGDLPPAQIVSGGLSRSLSLDYELAVSLDATPATAPVYLLEWPAWTAGDVAAVAGNIGIEGEVVESRSGSFQVIGGSGELYVAPNSIQYVYTGDVPPGDLADDGTLLETARSWLAGSGLASTETDGGSIVGRDDDLGRAVALFKPAWPSPLLAFYPSATVTVGPDGTILEANVRLPAGLSGSDYSLKSGDELWNVVLAGEGSIEADLSGVAGDGPLSGTLTVTEIWVAYSYAAGGGQEFLVPLIVFSGHAQLDEVDASVPVSVYVPAVHGEAAPRG